MSGALPAHGGWRARAATSRGTVLHFGVGTDHLRARVGYGGRGLRVDTFTAIRTETRSERFAGDLEVKAPASSSGTLCNVAIIENAT